MTILLDFYADWCQPCKAMKPMLDVLEKELPDVVFKKINIDDEPAIAQAASVMSIPTLVIEKEGIETGRIVGATTKEKILALL